MGNFGIRKFVDKTSDQVIEILKEQFKYQKTNLKFLGDGLHGAVFGIHNYVYKFWLVDFAYEEFLKYCAKNQHNKFLPRLQSNIRRMPAFFLRDKKAPDVLTYIKMERMSELDGDESLTLFKIFATGNSTKTISASEVCELVDYMDTREEVISELRKRSRTEVNPDLLLFIDTLRDLKGLCEQHNYYFDLERNNNLMRRGGQLVISDPLCEGFGIEQNTRFQRFNRSIGYGKQTIGKSGILAKSCLQPTTK